MTHFLNDILRQPAELQRTIHFLRGTGKQALTGAKRGAEQFTCGARLYAASGGGAAIAGIAVAAGVAIGVDAIEKATEYGKALAEVAKQAGLSAEELQVYQHAAAEGGVSQDQFNTALRELSENLGRARTGSQEQAKVFAALGIDIKNAATAGDLLPTLINRISSIPDQAKRARVELALFGESGAKLDGMLSGGNARIDELANGLQKTGAILSTADIQKLDQLANKLGEVKAELMADISSIVANNAASIMKLVTNLISACTVQALAESLATATRHGISPEALAVPTPFL